MDYMAELAAIAKENGGIIETKTAAQYGISKAMLYKTVSYTHLKINLICYTREYIHGK